MLSDRVTNKVENLKKQEIELTSMRKEQINLINKYEAALKLKVLNENAIAELESKLKRGYDELSKMLNE
jgi:hypothetical protein